MRSNTGLTIGCLLLTLLLAFSVGYAQKEAKEGGTITTVSTQEPGNLDPHKTGEAIANNLFLRIGLTLVDINPQTEDYEGVLAQDWDVSEDELTWTFHLRENVKFHDGRTLTAGDFVKTFERAKELGNVAGDLLDSVEEVKAEDDHTLVLELSETTGLLLHNLSQGWLMPISVKSLEEMGEDKFSRQPVSVGPWEVEKWQSGQQITLSRFEDYNWAPTWFENQGPPYPEELVMKFIPEEETRIAALRAGEINLAELPSKYVDDFEEMDDFSLGQILRRGLGLYLFFNFKKETLAQLEVRKAINHALQRSSILEIAESGRGVTSFGPLPPSIWGYDEEVKEYGYHYDPDNAKDLLAQAGWEDSDGDGILDRNGDPMEFSLYTYNAPAWQRAAQVIQAQLKEIGISAEIQTYEWGSYTEALTDGEHDLALMGYHYEDPDVLYLFLHSSQIGEGINWGFLEDAELDALLEKGRLTPSQEERLEVYSELQRYIVEKAIWAPIYTEYEFTAIHESVNGVTFHPTRAHAEALLQDAWVETK